MDRNEVYFESLSKEEKHLVALKEILYEGSWDEIAADLMARRDGKPHVIKLESRIDDDLRRIEKLREYESEAGVSLGTFLRRADFSSKTRSTGTTKAPKK